MFELLYTKEAKDNIDKLNLKKKRQIKDAVERISKDPETGKRLTGSLKGLYSFRSGDYRIIYKVFHERVTVIVITVGHRKDVYEKAAKRAGGIRDISLNEKQTYETVRTRQKNLTMRIL
jgi:mRNA interferase RelE/StbE